jgi:hypothetical protein
VFSAFDNPKSMFRYDQYVTPSQGLDLAGKAPKRYGGKIVRTPAFGMVSYMDGEFGATVQRADGPRPPWTNPFDARAVGLMNLSHLSNETAFDPAWKYLQESKFIDAVEEKHGVFRLDWLTANDDLRVSLWIDEKKGFSPTRMETYLHVVEDGKTPVDELLEICESTWIEVSGVWVPRSFRVKHAGDTSPKDTSLGEMTLDWEGVNQPINEKAFTVDGFTMPPGSVVIDNRLNVPIIIERIGDEPFPPPVPDREAATWWPSGWRWVVGGSAVLLVGSIGLWCGYRKRRKPGLVAR